LKYFATCNVCFFDHQQTSSIIAFAMSTKDASNMGTPDVAIVSVK
jgi:hypothetical protein